MADQLIRLGGFVLRERIGRGGMGEVWRGVHRQRGVVAAVKVVTARHARLAQGLQAEMRAVASLDHPHIVRLFDTGTVPAEAVGASDGRLAEGDPWFAMELVEGGDLSELAPDWPTVRQWLVDLLAALAHAHARGFVHCDSKPDNVLLDADGAVMLTDFGIVRAMDRMHVHDQPSGGTPVWMAPEQFLNDEANLGPWTDLYALGCMAYFLVVGRPPHGGKNLSSLMRAHLNTPLPGLKPRFGVPDDLHVWLDRLTAKDPGQRYRRAADAAWALQRLPMANPKAVHTGRIALPSRPTEATPTRWMSVDLGSALELHPPRPPVPPPLSADWADLEDASRPPAPAHLGLGLLRHREIPMVGRRGERTVLWDALRQADEGTPRAVLLMGPAGCGKSALARWTVHQAHACGAATPFKGTPAEGGDLARTLATVATRTGARPEDLAEHLTSLGVADVAAVEELLDPPDDAVHLTDAAKRLATTVATLRTCAEGRVLLVWLDDAHLDPEAMALAHALLAEGGRTLLLLTIRDDLLADQPEATEALQGLTAHDSARTVRIEPSSPAELGALLERAAPLEPALADEVVRRAEGVPLFALQLVADWRDRGVLVPHGPRWGLAPGTALPVPVDLRQIWLDRVEAALDGCPPGFERALQAAAALGREVPVVEWREVCLTLTLAEPPVDLVPQLEARGLAHHDPNVPDQWHFTHGLLPESVLAAARNAAELHRACAEVLADRGPSAGARRAAHLAAAGRPEDAMEAWLAAVRWLQTRDLGGALRAARQAVSLASGRGGRTTARALLALAKVHRVRASHRAWVGALEQALVVLRDDPDPGLQADALASLGWAHTEERRLEEARALGQQAAALLPQITDPSVRYDVLANLGIMLVVARDNERAIPVLRAAAEEAPSGMSRGQMLTMLGWALGDSDDLQGAIAVLREAEPLVRGTLAAEVQWAYNMGHIKWEIGDRPGGLSLLRQAVALRVHMGSDATSWMANLAGHEVRAGEVEAAEATLARLTPAAAEAPKVRALRVRIAAVREDPVAVEEALDHLERAEAERLGLSEANWLEESGDGLAREHRPLARRCWRLARQAQAIFGRDDAVERIDAKLAGRVRFHR